MENINSADKQLIIDTPDEYNNFLNLMLLFSLEEKEKYKLPVIYPETLDDIKKMVESYMLGEQFINMCCYVENKLVGIISVFITPDHFYINKIYLIPEERGKGYGSYILKHTITKLTTNYPDVSYVTASCITDQKLIKFYVKQGFEHTGDLKFFSYLKQDYSILEYTTLFKIPIVDFLK